MEEFHAGLAEILEIEPSAVTPELVLAEHAWDSLALVSTIALIDDCFGLMLPSQELTGCVTVGDIEALIRKQQA